MSKRSEHAPVSQAGMARRVLELACRAPSVHNTQPWWWRIVDDAIELHADRTRQLPVADPDGRSLVLSCGAALHHACVAATALGVPASVVRHPDDQDPDHLATLRLGDAEPTAADLQAVGVLEARCTDRRRFTSWPVPEERLAALAATATAPGALVVPLTDVTARFRTELLVRQAMSSQEAEGSYAEEQRRWIDRSAVDGVPSAAVAKQVRAHADRFNGLPSGTEVVEGSDGLLVVCSETDEAAGWLAAGEALSQVWLAATVEGLSVVPLSQVVEVPATRLTLRHHVLDGCTEPQLLLRLGWQEIGRSQLARTGRRPLTEVVRPARGSRSAASTPDPCP